MNTPYIAIDENYRIEVMPSGNHYPQRLTHPEWRNHYEGWSYWKIGNKQRSFKTEAGARRFITKEQVEREAQEQAAWDNHQMGY